jgi:hypothetical protein
MLSRDDEVRITACSAGSEFFYRKGDQSVADSQVTISTRADFRKVDVPSKAKLVATPRAATMAGRDNCNDSLDISDCAKIEHGSHLPLVFASCFRNELRGHSCVQCCTTRKIGKIAKVSGNWGSRSPSFSSIFSITGRGGDPLWQKGVCFSNPLLVDPKANLSKKE